MFTWGSKYLFGVARASLLGAAVYGLVSGGGLLGVVSAGYKGGVGEHLGYTVLVAVGVAASLLAVLNLVTRDGDAKVAAEVVGVDHALAVSAPRAPSFWGPLGAFGVASIIVGVAVSQAFFIFGIAILAVVALEWLVLAWSDRATGDPDVNSVIRSRILAPLEVPMLALLGIAAIVLGISRVLLAVPEAASTAIAGCVAASIFASAIGIAKSRAPRSVITGVVAAAAVAVLAGGIAAAAIGEREIAHHEESEDSGADATDSGTSGTSGTAGSGGDETSTSEGEGE
jgi:hypothetical protein